MRGSDPSTPTLGGARKNASSVDLIGEDIERAEGQRRRHEAIRRILERRSRAPIPIRSAGGIAATRREGRP
jgi:hypothetical protein